MIVFLVAAAADATQDLLAGRVTALEKENSMIRAQVGALMQEIQVFLVCQRRCNQKRR